jgi:hypothetical protein
VAVDLAPGEVVAEIGEGGVADGASVEGGEVGWEKGGRTICAICCGGGGGGWGEVDGPEVDVVGCECGEDGGEEFGGAALEERGAFVEDETGPRGLEPG